MGLASRFAAVATAAFTLAIMGMPAEAADPCAQAGLQVLPSPFSPWKGAPLRVMAISEKPLDGTISLTGPDGRRFAKRDRAETLYELRARGVTAGDLRRELGFG